MQTELDWMHLVELEIENNVDTLKFQALLCVCKAICKAQKAIVLVGCVIPI